MLRNPLLKNALRHFSTFGARLSPVITSIHMVKLKNQSRHPASSVIGVVHSLNELLANDLSALDDFKKYCHDRNHLKFMWPGSIEKLKKMRLLNCPVARDVVLSAVSGSMLSLAVAEPTIEPLKKYYKR